MCHFHMNAANKIKISKHGTLHETSCFAPINEHLFQKWTTGICHKPKCSTQNGQRPSPNLAWPIHFCYHVHGTSRNLNKGYHGRND